MKASDIPDKFPAPFGVNAGPGFTRSIPLDPSGETGAASLDTGFPPDCFVDGGYPFGQDFNGLLLQITQWTQWQGAGALVVYDATYQGDIGGYPKGAIVESVTAPGWFYLSTADDNVTDPDAGGAGWRLFCPAPLYAIDTGTANFVGIVLNPAPPTVASLTGMPIVVRKSSSTNTTSTTMQVNSVGGPLTASILHGDNSSINSGELPAAEPFTVVFDGSNFILQSVANTALALPANSVTNAKLATMADQTVKGNVSGGTATPTDVPISSIGGVFAGAVIGAAVATVPTGYLACDGSSLLRATYPALFAFIGTTYGSVDGTHFSLPDFRSSFLRGFGAFSLGYGVSQSPAIQDHTHYSGVATLSSPTPIGIYGSTTTNVPGSASRVAQEQNASPATQPITSGVKTSNVAVSGDTHPLNYAINWCIKY